MSEEEPEVVASRVGDARFKTELRIGPDRIVADEPVQVGGGGEGPTPYELLSAALAACTSMTLRLYASGKSWELPDFDVAVSHSVMKGNPPQDRFDRRILFKASLPADRLSRLLEMADHCPVHRTLSRTSAVFTSAQNGSVPQESASEHFREMEEACASVPA